MASQPENANLKFEKQMSAQSRLINVHKPISKNNCNNLNTHKRSQCFKMAAKQSAKDARSVAVSRSKLSLQANVFANRNHRTEIRRVIFTLSDARFSSQHALAKTFIVGTPCSRRRIVGEKL